MKHVIAWKVFLVIVLMMLIPLALAYGQKQSGPKYDAANEVVVSGTIDEIKTLGPEDSKDTHLMLKTDKGMVEVCLCPAKFLTEMDMKFAKGDKIEVTGAKAKDKDDVEVILARSIVKGETTMVLRDKSGGPVWTWMMK